MEKKKKKYNKPSIKSKKIKISFFSSPRMMDSVDFLLGIQEVKAQSTSTCGGCGSCLKADSMVLMADGSEKRIDQIVQGDIVKSYNTLSGQIEDAPVLKVIIHKDHQEGYLVFNNQLKITKNHKIFINGTDWISSDIVEKGQSLLDSNNNKIPIESIDLRNEICDVVDLQVEGDNHNFFADHILVHNKMCLLGKSRITMADGSIKPIKSLHIGDRVLSFKNESLCSAEVLAIDSHFRSDGYIIINKSLHATNDHKVFVSKKGWVRMDELAIGDILFNVGKNETIFSIEKKQGIEKVYTLFLEDHTTSFFAEGYLVQSAGLHLLHTQQLH